MGIFRCAGKISIHWIHIMAKGPGGLIIPGPRDGPDIVRIRLDDRILVADDHIKGQGE